MSKYPYYVQDNAKFVTNIPYNEYYRSFIPSGQVYEVTDFGATEGDYDSQEAINKTIETASNNGGGVVHINGKYNVSMITLQDNVTLWLDKDCVLTSLPFPERTIPKDRHPYVIGGINVKNVKIVGEGKVSGKGETFCYPPRIASPFRPLSKFNISKYINGFLFRINQPRAKEDFRPFMVYFQNSTNIEVCGVELHDAGVWTCVMEDSDDIAIHDLIINANLKVANADGIDIVGCSNVDIKHCFISSPDDCICIKSHKNQPSHQIRATDCKILSLANGIKIGTETKNDIYDVIIDNCTMFKGGIIGGYAGISIESCDGANVHDIQISDITMEDTVSPLLIWLGNRLRYNAPKAGSIKDITIKNIVAENIDMPMAVVGCIDKGIEHNVENVLIQNVTASYRNIPERLIIKKHPTEKVMQGYPDIQNVSKISWLPDYLTVFFNLPCYGLYQRHTKGLVIKDINITPRTTKEKRKLHNI